MPHRGCVVAATVPVASGCKSGVVRRQKRDIERLLGWERFRQELNHRGFHAVENAGQVVIFCNQDAVRIIR
ncbi:N-(5'-phosphoribosyl)anthranilate isomerase [Phaeobacter inhibens]|uniref:N-(5'-phosphoribosyl)anthranilate isomerase n=1 Tax=Phaeobacter inhibens TaxID=221822 RepID=UPI000CA17180|nr:N-(5'-phosphoribosyl)anthranilate isomerase [Phaeobacter inhibens]AUQ62376.1 hypothetical protein PhaeoP51_01381 [Phaeobacter inhibens]AUQ82279.1 hypothetical protein PhaeoP57_01341 [Phaeobacter inhibens]AUQ90040.1 hypothetical protein PhaeoP24_01415 [Phaeobacter inhibens]MDO6755189.1 N-(5'-phosphoribosyl)anthranilate isomerase [Phaeobacter inhibens]